MATLSVSTWIGHAFAVLCGKHGAITEQAHQTHGSRQTVYDHAVKVQAAVTQAQLPGPSRADLLRDHACLREELRQLWQFAEILVSFDQPRQQPFAATASAMGLSLTPIVVWLTIVSGAAGCPSRAQVGRWVQAASQRAGRNCSAVLDGACRALVRTLCLDEILLRRRPVLMAVEPLSMTWVLGPRAPDRSGDTWTRALQPWPQLTYAVVDGGGGLRCGLERTLRQRRQAPATLGLQSQLDNFHIQQAGHKALRGQWQEAEALWQQAERADRLAWEKGPRRRPNASAAKCVAYWAWQRAEKALAQAEQREAAYRRVVAALELFRADGTLNDRVGAQAEIQAALADLPGPRWAKFRRMVVDERALTFLDRLQRHLQEAEPRAERRGALVP